MNNSAFVFYSEKSKIYSTELKSVTQKSRRFAWFRFAAFLFIFAPLFVFELQSWTTLFSSLFAIALLFFLIKKNILLDEKKRKLEALKKIADDELLALKHSFSHFYNGKEFLDTDHFFSYDLDLFGEGSLFQFINRCSTVSGRQKLASTLISPSTEKVEIEKRQAAIKELSLIPNWRIHFLANGNLFKETEDLNGEIKSWSNQELPLNRATLIKWLIRIVPVLTLAAFIPSLLRITDAFLTLGIILQWGLMFFFWKRITEYFGFFGRKSELLEKYMHLLKFVEEREFKTKYLLELQKKVKKPDSASKIFKQLKSLVKELEYRQNIVVGIFLNSLFLWDIRCVYKLWRWHSKNHKKLAEWLDVIAEMDALISLGNYANNHSDFVFPEIHEGGFSFDARKLGHPLLQAKKRICNDLDINGWSKVVIVTGANMAGKSTFLRTVGVNLILARIGAPVCAEKMKFTPIDIYTNMRTTDSLLKDESYFFAELKRLQGVLERLRKGERIFVILDEMLKGTNSVDKLNGSRELIRKLLELKSVSLIATHDLKLGELEEEYPHQVFNKCFEIKIEDDEMVFDYLLSDGVTKTMNATFLMKKMGLI
jgi:DNA mismatch repair ATPase MutS